MAFFCLCFRFFDKLVENPEHGMMLIAAQVVCVVFKKRTCFPLSIVSDSLVIKHFYKVATPNLMNRKMQQNIHIICMIQKNVVILHPIPTLEGNMSCEKRFAMGLSWVGF